jgi:hypothetical protein
VLVSCVSLPVTGQERLSVRADALFYGDNTEFSNPFREGETLFGAAARVAGVVEMNDRTSLTIGVFGNQRFGSDDAFEEVRPVIALTVRGARSSFVMGTLPPPSSGAPTGPDRGGPHGLLPPFQRETLSYIRPYEAGLEWTFAGDRIKEEFWINWQRLNTPEHRERFDGGLNASIRVHDHVAVPVQLHVVHEGGQLFASGAVADSAAAGAGVEVSGNVAGLRATLEAIGAVARFVPDRSQSDRNRDGAGVFLRAAGEKSGWRGHVIFWRGRDFIKEEGDPNYLSIRRTGERYRGTRDYAEAGLAKRFALATASVLEVSGRLHRIEDHYEYSYRILSIISAAWPRR